MKILTLTENVQEYCFWVRFYFRQNPLIKAKFLKNTSPENEILKAQALNENPGKPEKIIDKMVVGRLIEEFYKKFACSISLMLKMTISQLQKRLHPLILH